MAHTTSIGRYLATLTAQLASRFDVCGHLTCGPDSRSEGSELQPVGECVPSSSLSLDWRCDFRMLLTGLV